MVRAFDPAVRQLPQELEAVRLAPSLADAVSGADAAVVCTEWPVFRQESWASLVTKMRQAVVVDPNRFLEKELMSIPNLEHLSVGRAS